MKPLTAERESWAQDLAAEFMPIAEEMESRRYESWQSGSVIEIVSQAFTLADSFQRECNRRLKKLEQKDKKNE